MARPKRRLTQAEEFEIWKIVVDKILWIGIIILLYGFYLMTIGDVAETLKGLTILIAGAILLIILLIIFVREYEYLKS